MSRRKLLLETLEDRILCSVTAPVAVHSAQKHPAAVHLTADPSATITPQTTAAAMPTIAPSNTHATVSATATAPELIVVNSNLPDAQELIAELTQNLAGRSFQVLTLDSYRDGIDQITAFLAQSGTKFSAIHLLGHGEAGEVTLGTTQLNTSDLESYSAEIARWSASLTTGADVLFYGCSLAANGAGQQIVQRVAQLTGATVAASTDDTGAAALGGNWKLEYSTGPGADALALGMQPGQTVAWSHLLSGAPIDGGVGAFIGVVGNKIYSISFDTGKATLLGTSSYVGNNGTLNSVGVDSVNGIVYYADSANGSKAIYGFDLHTGQQFIVTSDVTTFGVKLPAAGLGAAGGDFAGGNFYFSTEGGGPNNTDQFFKVTFASGSNGRTAQSISTVDYIDGSNEFGDFLVIPGSTTKLYSFNSGVGVDEYNLTASPQTLTLVQRDANTNVTQAALDRNGNMYTVGTAIRTYNPAGSGTFGSPLTITTNGTTALGNLADGASYVPAESSIGDRVWSDANLNGVQDAGEAGVVGVTVSLYDDLNGNGQLDAGERLLATTTTGAGGAYTFGQLLPGDYLIQVSDPGNVMKGASSTTGGNLESASINLAGQAITTKDFGYEAPATVSVSSPSVTEGTNPYAIFTVSLSNIVKNPVSVNLALANGTATGGGVDYGAADGTNLQVSTDGGTTWTNGTAAIIAAGSTSVLVRTPIIDDSLNEAPENFTLTATKTAGLTANNSATGTATITDNDPLPSLAINDVTVNEGAGTTTFTVTLNAASGQAVSVNYATNDGTATAGANYSASSGVVNFAPGVTTQTITVPIVNDAIFEGSETFNVLLSAPVNATLADGTGIGTIRDDGTGAGGTDNDTPSLTVSSPNVTEGTDQYAVFAVNLSNLSTTPVSVNLALTDGTATGGGVDYGASGATNLQVSTDGGTTWNNAATATIAPGSTGVLVRTPIIDDATAEPTENFMLTATRSAGTTSNAAATGMASIADNDAPGSLSINDVTVNEGTGTATFTVTLSSPNSAIVSVSYGTNDGTAKAGAQYTNTSGTLSFAPGVTSQTITVPILNDTIFEGSDNFTVLLSGATNASIADGSGLGTIKDDGTGAGGTDNDAPTLSVGNVAVTEGADTYAVFTLSLSNASTTAVTANLALANGTATGGGVDFGPGLEVSTNGGGTWAAASSVNFAPGTTSVLARTPIVDDALSETAETFTLNATVASGTTANASASGTATIADNDPLPALAINDVTVNEGAGTATFTVSLSAPSGQAVSVNYATNDGTATAGVRYTSRSGALNFAAGVTSQTLTVPILNDNIYEGAQTFTVALSGASAATIADGLGLGTIQDDGTGTGGTDDDRPVNTLPATYSTSEDTSVILGGISISNPDPTRTVTVTLSAGSGVLNFSTSVAGGITAGQVSNNGSGTVTVTATVNAINATLADASGVQFVPTADFNGTAPLTLTTTDGLGTDSDNSSITVTPVADIVNDSATTNENTPLAIAVLANDNFENPGRTITAVNGQAITAGGPAVAVSTGTVALDHSENLIYTPSANYNGPAPFTYTVTSGGAPETGNVNITVTPVSGPMAISGPTTTGATEDTPTVFSTANGNALVIDNANGGLLTATISVQHGTLTLGSKANLTFITGNGTADATMTFHGTAADINTALNGLTFNPSADYNGPAQLNFSTEDIASTSPNLINGGFEQPTGVTTFNYFDQSQVPGWSTSASDGLIEIWKTGYEGVPSFEGNQFAEINATQSSTLSQVISPVAGGALKFDFAHRGRAGVDTMNVTVTDLGPDGVLGGGDDTQLMSENFSDGNTAWSYYSRTLAAATGNKVLLQFTSVSTATGDQSVGNFVDGIFLGVPTAAAATTMQINVAPVRDAVNDSATTAEDTPVAISVLANDTFANPGRTITAVNGNSIVANGPAVAVAHGTVALNNAEQLVFTPSTNYDGPAVFTYTVTSSGTTETANVDVTMTPVNDAPTLDLDSTNAGTGTTGTFVEDGAPTPIVGPNVTITDPDSATMARASVQLTNAQPGDELSIFGTLPAGIAGSIDTSVAGQITVTLSGAATPADYQTALQQIEFSNSTENPATVTRNVSVSVNDGGLDSNSALSAIDVVAVNDAPGVTLPPAQAAGPGTPLAIHGVSFSDVDAGNSTVTVALSTTGGTLTVENAVAGGLNAGQIAGNGTDSVTLTGSLAQIDATLADVNGLSFLSAASGNFSITAAINDNGNTGVDPSTLGLPNTGTATDEQASGNFAMKVTPPMVSIANISATEGTDQYAIFEVKLGNPSSTDVTVQLATASGTATGGGVDFGPGLEVSTDGGSSWSVANSATFTAGATSVLVRTPVIDDALNEAAETFTLSASVTSGATTNASATSTATIVDNDPLPALSINDVTVNEAAGTATFTVSLNTPSGQAVSVGFATSDGTAIAGANYTNTSGTLNFAAGVTTQTITVPILNDAVFEQSQTFDVNLSGAMNATIADNLGLGTIKDDGTGAGGTDNDTPSLSVSSSTVREGIDGHAVFTVALSNPSTTPVSVSLVLADGTATGGGVDYGAGDATNLQVSTDGGATWNNATTATIAPGSSSVLVRTPIVDDALNEAPETFTLTVTRTAGTTTNLDVTGTTTIADNDPLPALSINDLTVNERAGTATFTVSLNTPSGQAVSVNYTTNDATARSGSDYTATSGTLNFTAGMTSQTVTVPIIDDSVFENTESFNVVLSGAVNAAVANNTGVGTILDDDVRQGTLSLIGTSSTGTSGTDVTVGEVVTYEMKLELAQGVNSGVTLESLLPAGMQFLPNAPVDVAYQGVDTSVTGVAAGSYTNASADSMISASLTSNDDTFNSGTPVFFKLGDLVDNDSDSGQEFVTVRFNAVVTNTAANQAGVLLANQFAALVDTDGNGTPGYVSIDSNNDNAATGSEVANDPLNDGSGSPGLSNPVTTKVAEPILVLDKQITNAPTTIKAGATITYTVTISHAADSDATAWEATLADAVPAGLQLSQIDSVTLAGGAQEQSAAAIGGGGSTLGGVWGIPVGGSVTVVYDATVTSNAVLGSTLNNLADVTWSSLDGNAPGARSSGDSLLGAGGLNDYELQKATGAKIDGGASNFSLTKQVVGATSAEIGQRLTYQLTLTVADGTINSISLNDLIPSGLLLVNGSAQLTPGTGVSVSGATFSYANNQLTLDIAQLQSAVDGNANTVTITYEADVLDTAANDAFGGAATSTKTNVATASYDPGTGPISAQDSATLNIVEPVIAASESIIGAPAKPNAGDTITFQVVVGHAAASTGNAYNVIYSDTLPAEFGNVQLVGVSGTASALPTLSDFAVNGDTISTVNPFDVELGKDVVLTYTAVLGDTVTPGEVLTNNALVTAQSIDSSPSGNARNSGSATNGGDYAAVGTATLTADSTFNVSTLASTSSATIGDRVHYTITVNVIEGTTPSLVLTDALPNGPQIDTSSIQISYGAPGMSASNATPASVNGNTLTLDFGDLTNPGDNNPNNDTITIGYDEIVSDNANDNNGDVKINTVSGTYSGLAAPVTSSSSVTLTQPVLDLAKSVDDSTPHLGQTITYTLVITHDASSTADAFDLALNDPLSAGVSLNAASIQLVNAPAGTSITSNTSTDGGPLQLALNQLALGQSATITFTATVTSDPALIGGTFGGGDDSFSSTAALSYDGQAGSNPDQRVGNASAANTITVVGGDLAVTVDDGQTTANDGSRLTYTVTVTNNGTDAATNVVLSDTLPASDATFNAGLSTAGATIVNGKVVYNIPSLGAGQTETFDVVVDLATPTSAGVNAVTNSVSATQDDIEPTPADNSASDTDTLLSVPDYTITVGDGRTSSKPGDSVDYVITVKNVGNQNGTGVVVNDAFATGIFSSLTADNGGVVDLANGTIVWNLGNLDSGQTVTLNLHGVVNSTFANIPVPIGTPPGDVPDNNLITHSVSVTDDGAGGADPTPANNTASDIDDLQPVPDLKITASDGVSLAKPGQTLTYVINATNVGPQDSRGTVVTDRLPIGVTFVRATSSDPALTGTPTVVNGVVTWQFTGAFPTGETVTFDVVVKVNADAMPGAPLTNRASITDNGQYGPDSTPGDNAAVDTNPTPAAIPVDPKPIARRTAARPAAPLVFTFDTFNDFANVDVPVQHFGQLPHDSPIDMSAAPLLPLVPIYSGEADPGATLVISIYNARGEQISAQTVMADAGGNWLATFPSSNTRDVPNTVEISQLSAPYSLDQAGGHNLRTYFSPALNPGQFFFETGGANSLGDDDAPLLGGLGLENPLQLGDVKYGGELLGSSASASGY